ncbi:MAG: serine O-acetyltransferase [Gammaproteobacteria bacterium]|nr:serine O-acetyltransferase [Gammaproteobacteria bacterium]
MNAPKIRPSISLEQVWCTLKEEAELQQDKEPLLTPLLFPLILQHATFAKALNAMLSSKIQCSTLPEDAIHKLINLALSNDADIVKKAQFDLLAFLDRDPACDRLSLPFLYYKGYQGLQLHRIGHWLWHNGKSELALYLQSQVSASMGIDIHPAAKIGKGILIDHANSLVIGETAVVVGDDVSMLHEVTLGGTGKDIGDRHPKVKSGVLIGAGAKILGNVIIGKNAKVGAGSVVLNDVPDHLTVAGIPAKVVGDCRGNQPALVMDHYLETP